MDTGDVAVATMTWARDAAEERLLRESLPLLADVGLPVFVTDGGSGAAFRDFLGTLPHVTPCEPTQDGLWAQVRRSLRAAADTGRRFILYTEPDKRDFFRGGLREFLSRAPAGEGAGIVLASRDEASYSTFPAFQQGTEEAINLCCAEVVGEPFDFSYGPFLLERALVPRLEEVGHDLGWGWRPYTFGLAHSLGLRVERVSMPLPCPPEQRGDSPRERLYRMRQLGQSIEGLLLSTTAARPPRGPNLPSSR